MDEKIRQVSNGHHILIVDDDEAVRRLIQRLCLKIGYTCSLASNGEEALEICMRDTPTIHLMLTDTVMPGMSRRQLADRVKTHRADMKVLFMSGYTDNAIVHHGILEEGIAFIQKPFTPKGLARKVREVLGRSDE